MDESGWRGEGRTEEAGEPEEGDDDDRDEETGQTAVPAPSPAHSSSTARVLGFISFNRAGGQTAVFHEQGHEQERERRVRFM